MHFIILLILVLAVASCKCKSWEEVGGAVIGGSPRACACVQSGLSV